MTNEPTQTPRSQPDPVLTAKVGNKDGVSFRLKARQSFVIKKGRRSTVIGVPAFHRAAIYMTGRRSENRKLGRLLVLESAPNDEPTEYEFHGFYVRGRFRIVEKVNQHSEAHHAWQEFEAE